MHPKKILVVEDEIIIAKDIESRLTGLGYRVSGIAASGEKAIDLVRTDKPDLVLMDVHLRGRLNGIDAAERIQSEHRVPVIFVSGYSDDATIHRMKQSGPYGFLNKPIDDNRDLKSAIEIALSKHGMETTLREREAWLDTTLRSIADAIVSTDSTGRVIFVNPAAEALTGWTAARAIGKSVQKVLPFVHERSGKAIPHPFIRLLQTGTPAGFKTSTAILRADRIRVPVDGSGSLIHDASGKPRGCVFAFRDLRPQRESEQTLRHTKEKFETVFKHSTDAVCILRSADQMVLEANDRFLELTGRSRNEILGKSWRKLPIIRHLREAESIYKEFKGKEALVNRETVFLSDSHGLRTVLLSLKRINVGGDPCVLATANDITEQKQAEEERRLFRDLLDRSNDAVFIASAITGRFVVVNDTACWMLGISRARMLTLRMADLDIRMRSRRTARTVARNTIRSGNSTVETVIARSKGGPIHLEINANLIRKDGDRYVVGIARDVTERKRAEEALRESETKYKALVETTDTGYVILDSKGKVLDANKEYVRQSGHKELKEILGRKVVEWTAKHDRARNAAELKKCLKQGFVRNLVVDHTDRRGKTIPVEINSTVIRTGQSARIMSLCRDITERTRSEHALRVSEERMRRIVDSAPFGAHMYTLKGGRLVFAGANPAADRILGIQHARLLGKTIERAFPGLAESPIPRKYRRIAGQGGNYEDREVHYDEGGIRGAFDIHAFQTGENQMAVFFRDVTERQKAEQSLRESEERYRHLFEMESDAIVMVDNQTGKILEANAAAMALYGYTRDEWLGMKNTDVSVEPDKTRKVMADETTRIPVRWHKKKDGTVFPVEITASFFKWGGRKVHVAAIRDITERMRAEEALQEREKKFRAIVETTQEWIWAVDLEGRHTYSNPALERILGYSVEEMVGKERWDFIHPEDRPGIQSMMLEKIKACEGWSGLVIRWLHKNGGCRYLESNSAPIMDSQGNLVGYQGADRDITDRMHAAEMLRRENAFRSTVIRRAAEGIAVCHAIPEFPFVAFTVWNDRMAEITGYTMEEINRLGWYQTVYPDPEVRKRAVERMSRMRTGDDLIGEEWVITRAGGERRTLSIFTSDLDMGDGETHVIAFMQDITERKKTEEALHESEEFFRILFDESPIPLVLSDLSSGAIAYCNQKFQSLLGRSREELLGRTAADLGLLHDPQDQERLTALLRAKGTVDDLEVKSVKRQGGIGLNLISMRVITLKGRPHGLISVQDITDRKGMEEALRRSEHRYHELIESARDAIFSLSPEGAFTSLNKAFGDITGWTIREWIGKPFADLLHPEDIPKALDRLSKVMQGHSGDPLELRIRKKSGEYITGEIIGNLQILNDKVEGILCVGRDISGRKRVEEALRESEAKFRILHQSMMDAFVSVDMEGRIIDWNDSYLNMLGYTPVEVNKLTYRDVTPEKWHALQDAIVEKQVLPNGYSDIYEKEYRRKDGTVFPVELRTMLIRDTNGSPIRMWAIVRDITDRKRAEETQLKLALVAQHSSELINLASLDGTMTFLNEAGSRMLGISPLDVDRHSIMEVIPEHLRSLVQNELLPALMEKGRWEGNLQYCNIQTGQLTDVHAMAFTIRDAKTGTPLFLANVSRDITEGKRAEEALRQSEERLSSFMDSASDSFYLLDSDLRFVEINPKGLEITGKKKEEIIGKSIIDIVPDVVESGRYQRHQEVIRTGKPFIVEDFIPHPVFGNMHFILKSFKVGDGLGVIASDITERKQAENALRESERKARAIFDLSFRFMGLLTPDGTLLDANRTALEFAGVSLSDVKGKPFWETPWWSHSKEMQDFIRTAVKSAAEGNMVRSEAIHRAKDGSHHTIDFTLKPIKDETGKISFLIPEGRDITERKQAEEALRASEEQFRTTFEQAAVGIAQIAPDGRFLRINQRLCEIVGYTREELLTRSFQDITHPDDLGIDVAHLHQLLANEIKNYSREKRYIRKDGSNAWVNLTVSLLREPTGAPKYFISVIEDIAERKRAEDALRESEERMRLLASAAFDGIGITDQGKVAEANDQLAHMLGYSREEMIGRPVMEMVAPESREWVMAHIHEGSEQPYEHLALRKDGSVFPVEVQARVIPFKGRSARVSAIRDITEQNKTKAIMENAQRASRLASLGILTGGISHEINQPLTALKVKVDGMLYWEEKDPGSLSKNLVPNLKFISSEAEKIDAIIRHIRSLIRHEKVAAQPVDLNETVRRAMSVLRYQLASHNIHVDLRLGSGPPYAMANETSVSQVLLNLVAYAMNAHDTVDKDHKWIRIVTRSRPSMAILIVADNGPGIPEENRRRIFEPLFTTQAVGTGLGLPIVQFLVQEYEGVIRVRNRPSGGVAFMVMYPASAGRSPEAS